MNSRVPLSLEWDGQGRPLHFEPGFTRVVNNYGCLLVSPREVDAKQRLRLTNLGDAGCGGRGGGLERPAKNGWMGTWGLNCFLPI